MSEETKLKVKDLPESERTELLLQMEKAGLRGAKTEYGVETARAKVKEWQEANPVQPENVEQGGGEQNGENAPLTTASADETVNNPPENADKKEVKSEKTLICHRCRGKVINGVCTKCGFKRGK